MFRSTAPPSRLTAAERLERLRAFAAAAGEQDNLDDLLWTLAEQIGRLLGYEDCVIYLRNGDVLEQVAAFGVKTAAPGRVQEPIAVPVGQGIVGTVALTGEPELVAVTRCGRRYIADQFEGASELAVPIRFEGRTIGVLDSEASLPGFFGQDDLKLFETIADIAAVRIAWLRSERRRQSELENGHEERLEALGRLGGGIAHDINNQLAVLALSAELARHADTAAEQEEALAEIDDAVTAIRSITRRLQVFSSGGAPLREPLELGPLVRQVLASMELPVAIALEVREEHDLPWIQGDPAQLREVVEGLVSNAVEAMEGRGRLRIELICPGRETAEPSLALLIRDDGPGVDAVARGRLFDPYFSSRGPGRGLGLATAYWIVLRHGGRLELLERGAATGAAFQVTLPAIVGRVAMPESVQSEATQDAVVARPLRILVLDDEEPIRRLIVRLLQRHGHRIETIADGGEAAGKWEASLAAGDPFDLALFDLVIEGGVGGAEALRQVLEVDPGARAVVMSGHSDDQVMARHREHGFVARLEKPFDARTLERALAVARRS